MYKSISEGEIIFFKVAMVEKRYAEDEAISKGIFFLHQFAFI